MKHLEGLTWLLTCKHDRFPSISGSNCIKLLTEVTLQAKILY